MARRSNCLRRFPATAGPGPYMEVVPGMHKNLGLRKPPVSRFGVPLVFGLLTACSYQTQKQSGQPGTLIITAPGSLPTVVSGPATPAQAVSGAPPVEPVLPPASGRYTGVAEIVSNTRNRCRQTLEIDRWMVSGDRVTFGAFRGTIAPDGSLSMQAGHAFIKGGFDGSRFTGRYWRPGPSCLYSLSVALAG